MTKILKPKIQASGFMDALELGIMKSVSERVLSPVIGNGTVQSGVIKGIGGGLLTGVRGNKHVNLLGSALFVDAIEDVVKSVLAPVVGGSDNSGGW